MSRKVTYQSKKECITKINHLKSTLGNIGLRPYEEDGKWYITHTKDKTNVPPPTAVDLLEAVFMYIHASGSDDDRLLIKKIFNKLQSIKKKEYDDRISKTSATKV